MKSFLEFVPCCGHAVRPKEPRNPPRRDEARSLPRGQRRRLNGSNSVSSSSSSSLTDQWQPTLCSISEDNAVSVVVKKAEEATRSSKKLTRPSRAKTHVRTTYGNDYGRASVPLAIPAFSPTAFLF